LIDVINIGLLAQLGTAKQMTVLATVNQGIFIVLDPDIVGVFSFLHPITTIRTIIATMNFLVICFFIFQFVVRFEQTLQKKKKES
jgi:NADH:ubiquinone oxidoreductase subunit 3 (subunit A)